MKKIKKIFFKFFSSEFFSHNKLGGLQKTRPQIVEKCGKYKDLNILTYIFGYFLAIFGFGLKLDPS